MKSATFIRRLDKWKADARLYRLSEPMVHRYYSGEGVIEMNTSFVIVSAVTVPDFGFPEMGGPETYIFPAREDGTAISMAEMDGSFKGSLDHEQALFNAGYGLVIFPDLQQGGGERP